MSQIIGQCRCGANLTSDHLALCPAFSKAMDEIELDSPPVCTWCWKRISGEWVRRKLGKAGSIKLCYPKCAEGWDAAGKKKKT